MISPFIGSLRIPNIFMLRADCPAEFVPETGYIIIGSDDAVMLHRIFYAVILQIPGDKFSIGLQLFIMLSHDD